MQASVLTAVAVGALDLHLTGPLWLVVTLAVANAVLGMALGLFLSAFAANEFQAVQFMPAFLLPQLLLCGLVVARDRMAAALQLSTVLPMTYAYDALAQSQTTSGVSGEALRDLGLTLAFTILSLALGAATLRRRTA